MYNQIRINHLKLIFLILFYYFKKVFKSLLILNIYIKFLFIFYAEIIRHLKTSFFIYVRFKMINNFS